MVHNFQLYLPQGKEQSTNIKQIWPRSPSSLLQKIKMIASVYPRVEGPKTIFPFNCPMPGISLDK